MAGCQGQDGTAGDTTPTPERTPEQTEQPKTTPKATPTPEPEPELSLEAEFLDPTSETQAVSSIDLGPSEYDYNESQKISIGFTTEADTVRYRLFLGTSENEEALTLSGQRVDSATQLTNELEYESIRSEIKQSELDLKTIEEDSDYKLTLKATAGNKSDNFEETANSKESVDLGVAKSLLERNTERNTRIYDMIPDRALGFNNHKTINLEYYDVEGCRRSGSDEAFSKGPGSWNFIHEDLETYAISKISNGDEPETVKFYLYDESEDVENLEDRMPFKSDKKNEKYGFEIYDAGDDWELAVDNDKGIMMLANPYALDECIDVIEGDKPSFKEENSEVVNEMESTYNFTAGIQSPPTNATYDNEPDKINIFRTSVDRTNEGTNNGIETFRTLGENGEFKGDHHITRPIDNIIESIEDYT
jgi:hypothetical protein